MNELQRVLVPTKGGEEVEGQIVARREKTDQVYVMGVDDPTVDGWYRDLWKNESD